jgi:hypothetical protein
MKWIGLIMILVGLALMAGPVMAAITDITAGGTVFLGEQGLDITAGLGANNQIAWFPSSATSTSATPEKVIDVTASKTNFYAPASEFSSYTGTWYSWAPGLTAGTATVAFRIVDPRLTVKVEDSTVGVDVTTNKWIYRGDEAKFRIETNLYTMAERPGVAATAPPITIKVQTPDGAVMTSLVNTVGTQNSLVDIPVATSPYTTAAFWDTGNALYAPGTYTVWAECNANGMKDNYNVEGKTVSSKIPLTVTEFNPLIKTAVTPAVVTTKATATATTAPPVTTVATTAGTTAPVPATTTGAPATAGETTAVPPTSAPARTYADGFTALLAVAACGAAALLVYGRFR